MSVKGKCCAFLLGVAFRKRPLLRRSFSPTYPFLERSLGKSFGLTPGGSVKTLFLYCVSEIKGKCCVFFFFVFVCLAQRPLSFFCSFL